MKNDKMFFFQQRNRTAEIRKCFLVIHNKNLNKYQTVPYKGKKVIF